MSEKISFKWSEKTRSAILQNANMHCKALLLEHIATPGTGLIQVRLDGKEYNTLHVHCGSLVAFMRCMKYCYTNMNPDEWENETRVLIELVA